jgi:uncharacterized protein
MDIGLFAQYLPLLAIVVATGVLGGFMAGLLGVGGGIVIVPVLYFLLGTYDVDASLRMKIAVATSLSTIVLTSISSARSHYKRGAVDMALLRSWAVPIFIGVVVGTVIGGFADGLVLTLVFAVMAMLVAINMLVRGNNSLRDGFPNGAVKAGSGVFIGLISAMMGIGGGTLSVPILTAFSYDIRRAVGTGAAIGFVIAVPGTIGYVLTGLGAAGLPPGSLGYVNVIALAALAPLTMLVAPLGTRVAHTIPKRALNYAFAAFLFLTSARMFVDIWQGL